MDPEPATAHCVRVSATQRRMPLKRVHTLASFHQLIELIEREIRLEWRVTGTNWSGETRRRPRGAREVVVPGGCAGVDCGPRMGR